MTQDEKHLDQLATFHTVVAGLAGVFSLLYVFHVVFGVWILSNPDGFWEGGEGPPPAVGWMMAVMGTVVVVLGLTLAVCIFVAGRSLARRRRYRFCQVMAGIECIFMPLGTVLGVFTLLVLTRESVRQLFAPAPRP